MAGEQECAELLFPVVSEAVSPVHASAEYAQARRSFHDDGGAHHHCREDDLTLNEIPYGIAAYPVVLLDSGQSLGESVFLEEFQRWLRGAVWRWRESKGYNPYQRTMVWILYPEERMEFRYHRTPLDEKYYWLERKRIIPIRTGGRKSLAKCFFQDFARSKENYAKMTYGRRWKVNPWRLPFWMRRNPYMTAALYLNPTKKDMDWMWENRSVWKNYFRVPLLSLGWSWEGTARYGIQRMARVLWTYDQTCLARAKAVIGRDRAYAVPWQEGFWDWLPKEPRHDVGIAATFRAAHTDRQPSIAKEWAYDWDSSDIYMPKDNGHVDDLLEATSCRIYVLATRWEDGIPFDVLVAAGRGATVVVPDDPRFRRILGEIPDDRKVFYPVRSGTTARASGIGYDHAEVRAWLRPRLRGRLQGAPCQL